MTAIDIPSWLPPILVAPFIGSFMGVLITRLPDRAPVAFARSACPHCGTTLSGWQMVPLLSFIVLRGRCRHCGRAIGWFYPAIELAATAVACWAVAAETGVAGRGAAGGIWVWADCGLGWTLLTLSWIDVTSFLLPDVLTLPLVLAGLALTWAEAPDALVDHCLATILGYAAFQALALAYRRLRGREGLGGGDAKLIAAAGAWCGLALLPFVILGSAMAGLLMALALFIAGRTMTAGTEIPYGPCIAAALWVAWLHGGLLDQMLGV